jgi:hypothetical protein
MSIGIYVCLQIGKLHVHQTCILLLKQFTLLRTNQHNTAPTDADMQHKSLNFGCTWSPGHLHLVLVLLAVSFCGSTSLHEHKLQHTPFHTRMLQWLHSFKHPSSRGLAESLPAVACPNLVKEELEKIAKENTILVAAADQLMAPAFGMNWIANVRAAGITYWLMAALDPEASVYFGSQGVTQCVNAPYGPTRKSPGCGFLQTRAMHQLLQMLSCMHT